MSGTRDGRFLWAGFVALAFGVLGILAVFATYAAPVPLERAMARDETLDQILALAASPAGPGQLEAFRPRLADSADAILGGSGPLEARVARERAAMHRRFSDEAKALARQLRLMIAVVTTMCIIFGGAVVAGFSSRQRKPE